MDPQRLALIIEELIAMGNLRKEDVDDAMRRRIEAAQISEAADIFVRHWRPK